MSALPATTDVVIVGAGPTGLALACVLAAERVSFVLVDQLAEGANTSRAGWCTAGPSRFLEELEVTDRLRAEGHVVPRFTLRDRDHMLVTIRFDGTRSATADFPPAKTYQKALFEAGVPLMAFAVPDVQGEYKRLTKRGVVFKRGPTKVGQTTLAVLNDT